jgi:hypothetical protein
LLLIGESLELAEKAEHQRPTISWSLQTRAFLRVLRGRAIDVDAELQASSRLHNNPNQQRRARLIRLIARRLDGQDKRSPGTLEDVHASEVGFKRLGRLQRECFQVGPEINARSVGTSGGV